MTNRIRLIIALSIFGFVVYVAGGQILDTIKRSTTEQSIRDAYNNCFVSKEGARRMFGDVVNDWPARSTPDFPR